MRAPPGSSWLLLTSPGSSWQPGLFAAVACLGKCAATGNPGSKGSLLLGLGWASPESGQVGGDRNSWQQGLSAAGTWLGKSRLRKE